MSHAQCKNCGHTLKLKFCPACGQSADTHEINLHFLWHDIQHGIFHFDKGLPFTIKALFTRPGHAIREFIEGKRIQYFKPVALLFIVAGLYMFLFHRLHLDTKMVGLVSMKDEEQQTMLKFMEFYSNNYALISLGLAPFAALTTFLAFRKAGFNYFQVLILVLYVTSGRLIISMISLPLSYYMSKSNMISLSSFMGALSMGYAIWVYLEFFNTLSLERRVLGLVYTVLWYLLFFIVMIFSAMMVIALFD